MFNGKIHYFYGHFNSKLLNYQRVCGLIPSTMVCQLQRGAPQGVPLSSASASKSQPAPDDLVQGAGEIAMCHRQISVNTIENGPFIDGLPI
jgi:hypothetical protein